MKEVTLERGAVVGISEDDEFFDCCSCGETNVPVVLLRNRPNTTGLWFCHECLASVIEHTLLNVPKFRAIGTMVFNAYDRGYIDGTTDNKSGTPRRQERALTYIRKLRRKDD